MSTQIRYKGRPITTIEKGTVTLKTEDFGLEGDIEVVSEEVVIVDASDVPITENGTYSASDYGADGVSKITVAVPETSDSPLPIEIASETEMNALLDAAEVGSVYKYMGTTGTYENGALYIVEAVT